MAAHLASNCELYSNKQLSKPNKKQKTKKKKDEMDGTIEASLKALDIQEKDLSNPYIDPSLLSDNKGDDQSLFGLLKSNPMPNMVDTSFAMDAMQSSARSKQLCPHCGSSDLLMDEEEFQIHIAMQHPLLINDPLTQAVFASFACPEILNGATDAKRKKKKKRKLSSDLQQPKKQKRNSNRSSIKSKTKWNCPQCTYANTTFKCVMCRTSRPK